MRKRHFIYEKTSRWGVFHGKSLTLAGGYGIYERKSVFADGTQLYKIEAQCSSVTLQKRLGDGREKGIIAEVMFSCLRGLGWCIAKYVMYCHLCGALSETRNIPI